LDIDKQECPCGGGEFAQCCQPVIAGEVRASSPERLMRARYSAYATGSIDFLETSNHSKTRRHFDPESAGRWSGESRWLGLNILGSDSSTPDRAHVNFEARYEDRDGTPVLHRERSLFEREDGEWRFVSGGRSLPSHRRSDATSLAPAAPERNSRSAAAREPHKSAA
jgi:SEC-C motif-containing protein